MPSKRLVGIVLILALVAALLVVYKILSTPSITVPLEEESAFVPTREIIGSSVEGQDIEAYTYHDGDIHLLFVGGIHGGYEWGSVLLAYEFMDYLQANPDAIPDGIKVSVIPNANPDGVYEVIGKEGRFSMVDAQGSEEKVKNAPKGLGRWNARGVDLNRNFDCNWQSESTWQSKKVSAGTEAFSEPETRAVRDFVLKYGPDAVVFWHSQADAVYASECGEGALPETLDIMNAYAIASGYRATESFTAYAITGDAEGWLASIGIPAITVELKEHGAIEWERNLPGIQAILEYYAEKRQMAR